MNRRKIIHITVPPILLLLVSFLGYKIWSTTEAKEKIVAATQYLPSIQLRKMDGSIFNTDSFKTYKQLLVLNYFNPECDHCQSMVQELFREQQLVENVKWLMITSASVEKTKRFADSMEIAKLQNVTVLNDTESDFIKTFGTASVPSFYVYKNGKLLRKHSGECSVAYLVKE
ncbi:TlpA family protein disulfide reductase [Sediminibacterium salmoneum]|uniref:TlpA family protein disulfide reductase n=1 Tax=Sediminibacterium salmoneum TaxID=426421 RepID=UPI00047C8CBB|nr:redoxin domain-containing protein [Sediminibacterium salmoneum]